MPHMKDIKCAISNYFFHDLKLVAPVGVLETHDVVLAEVGARLHLDDLQRHPARVGQPVHLSQRDVGRLVLAQHQHLVAVGDLGGAGDDDPVLGAVVVHLQAQGRARLDHDPLDLEARTGVDRVVPAPGAVDLAVQAVLGAATLVELRDDLLHVLAAAAIGDHHRVGRLDHHHVVQPHHADEPAGGVDQRVGAVLRDHVADAGIAVGILARHLPHRVPRPEVVPAGAQRHHADVDVAAGAALHHRVVHRLARHGGELGLAGTHEAGVRLAHGPGRAGRLGDVGAEGLQRLHPHRGLQHEHAAVPEVAPFAQVTLGGLQVRLLDELGHPGRAEFRGRADVAVAGLGRIRRDAQDGDHPLRGKPHRLLQRGGVGRRIGDGLVGRRHHQHRIGTAIERLQCRQRQRGRGVAAHRLQQDGTRRLPDLAQLVEHEEAVLLVADDQRGGDGQIVCRQRGQALCGFLEQALVAVAQHQELLGIACARQRPQPGAAAAGHDDGLDVNH